jgi:hypothetical protein
MIVVDHHHEIPTTRKKSLRTFNIYILTHAHSDHIQGYNARLPYKVHCSAVTQNLLNNNVNLVTVPLMQKITLNNLDFTFFPTQHTCDSIGFYCHPLQLLFLGEGRLPPTMFVKFLSPLQNQIQTVFHDKQGLSILDNSNVATQKIVLDRFLAKQQQQQQQTIVHCRHYGQLLLLFSLSSKYHFQLIHTKTTTIKNQIFQRAFYFLFPTTTIPQGAVVIMVKCDFTSCQKLRQQTNQLVLSARWFSQHPEQPCDEVVFDEKCNTYRLFVNGHATKSEIQKLQRYCGSKAKYIPM